MFLSIDIGGTKTLLALFSGAGIRTKRLKFKTSKSQQEFVKTLSNNLKTFIPESSRKKIKAITVAIPGVIQKTNSGYAFTFGNLDWPDIDLLSSIQQLFSSPVFFVNDASLAALYEATRRGRKTGKSIYLTFSTGIGGGIVKNGKLLEDSETFEPGHVTYSFNNSTLEWEDIASAKAIVESYHCKLLNEIPLTTKNIQDIVERISLGLIDIISTEKPDRLIIGGPLALIYNKLKSPLLKSLSSKVDPKNVKLYKALRPTESVIFGAYIYSKQNWSK